MPHKDPQARRDYHREYLRKRYAEDAEYRAKHRKRTKKNDDKYLQDRRNAVANFRKQGCALCGELESCCLAAHHLDPSKKLFNIGNAIRHTKYGAKAVIEELKKCICVCHNCHAKIHAGVISLSKREE